MKSKSNRSLLHPLYFIILDLQSHPTLNCLLTLYINKLKYKDKIYDLFP